MPKYYTAKRRRHLPEMRHENTRQQQPPLPRYTKRQRREYAEIRLIEYIFRLHILSSLVAQQSYRIRNMV